VLQALEADGRVESVQRVNTYELLSYNDPYFHLQKTVSEPDPAFVHHSVTGRNVSVGIVDTGVDRQHPELAARIVYSNNFVSHDQEDFDTDEHGTAVAGVIGSVANNELGIVGVAPEANLMIFKACAQNDLTRRASCDSFSLMKALVEVLRRTPDVLNLSLAGANDPLLTRLVKAALDQGVIVVAAVDHRNGSNGFPAAIPGVIPVSSAFQFDFDWMPENGVLAPGSEVLTTTPGATYAFRSGSSMSTAFVAGVAALLKEKNPQLSSEELSRLIHESALARVNEVPMVNICRVVNGDAHCPASRSLARGNHL
jgi:subtilisin family serine protease